MNKILEERKRRCQWLVYNGYTCDVDAGKVYNHLGKEVGYIHKKIGYKVIKMPSAFDKKLKQVLVHQFIFYYHHREVVDVINHIDGNGLNNSISNLEESSPLENMWNRPESGVSWDKQKQKWVARIRINYKRYHLGYFEKDDYHLAIQIYQVAKQLRDSKQVDNSITPLEFRNLIKSIIP
jgi:hypothetical protein